MPAPRINPKAKKTLISIRLPKYLIEIMDAMEGQRADLIEEAMLDHYKLKKPKRFTKQSY